MLQSGDMLVFKGSDLIYEILSRILKLFERDWDRWGWHMAFVTHTDPHTEKVYICESVGSGVHIVALKKRNTTYRVYHWFDEPPSELSVWNFAMRYLSCDYDVACYLWTGLQYLLLHFFNHQVPRLLDKRFTCWELVFLMAREMGKPIQSIHKYPMITDFLKAMEKRNG